jgi:hypothetical protein
MNGSAKMIPNGFFQWWNKSTVFNNKSYLMGFSLLSILLTAVLYIALKIGSAIQSIPDYNYYSLIPLKYAMFWPFCYLVLRQTCKVKFLKTNTYVLKAVIYTLLFWASCFYSEGYFDFAFIDVVESLAGRILLAIVLPAIMLNIITEILHLPYALIVYLRNNKVVS